MFLLVMTLQGAALPPCPQRLNPKNFDRVAPVAVLCQGWNEKSCWPNTLGNAKTCLSVLPGTVDRLLRDSPSASCRCTQLLPRTRRRSDLPSSERTGSTTTFLWVMRPSSCVCTGLASEGQKRSVCCWERRAAYHCLMPLPHGLPEYCENSASFLQVDSFV